MADYSDDFPTTSDILAEAGLLADAHERSERLAIFLALMRTALMKSDNMMTPRLAKTDAEKLWSLAGVIHEATKDK